MFQHRHYKAIAAILADAREEGDIMDEPAYGDIENRLIAFFRRDNNGFSEDRFRKACRKAPDMHGKDKIR